jgi:hypothetical protein
VLTKPGSGCLCSEGPCSHLRRRGWHYAANGNPKRLLGFLRPRSISARDARADWASYPMVLADSVSGDMLPGRLVADGLAVDSDHPVVLGMELTQDPLIGSSRRT